MTEEEQLAALLLDLDRAEKAGFIGAPRTVICNMLEIRTYDINYTTAAVTLDMQKTLANYLVTTYPDVGVVLVENRINAYIRLSA